jgi:hypothetical protein
VEHAIATNPEPRDIDLVDSTTSSESFGQFLL